MDWLCRFEDWQETCRALVEERVPVKVDPRVWDFQPWGHRLVVLRGEPDRKVGLIDIPDAHQVPPTYGWVVNCGPEVGHGPCGSSPHPCPVVAEDLVGSRVLFGSFAGQPIAFSAKPTTSQGEFGDFVLMTDGDLLGFDWSRELPVKRVDSPLPGPGLERLDGLRHYYA